MTHIHTGTTKANRRGSPANLSELYIFLRKAYPKDTDAEIDQRFDDRVCEGCEVPAYAQEASQFWRKLHRSRLLDPPKAPVRQDRSEQAAKVDADAKRVLLDAKRVLLLDMDIDGKKLRDMTREECLDKGGFLTRIGNKLKPKQTVGEGLSEADLKKLCNK